MLSSASESPSVSNYKEVDNLQMELVNALRLELKHNHPKDNFLFPRLLVLIPQLVQVCEEFRKNLTDNLFDHTENLSQTHELLAEIFDLQWRQWSWNKVPYNLIFLKG